MQEDFPKYITEESAPNSESIELTLEQKYKIVGKKDSILDKRGVHISVNYLDELIAQGIIVTDKDDLEAIADAVLIKFNEVREVQSTIEEVSHNLKFRKLEVERYISRHGLSDSFSVELLLEWTAQSLRWVSLVGTERARIIHDLRVMDLTKAGGDIEKARAMALDSYRSAVKEKQLDIVQDIPSEFPDFGKDVNEDK